MMDKYTYVGLHFNFPRWASVGNYLTFNYVDYIDMAKCTESDLPSGYERDPHCTILYNDSEIKGPNYMSYLMAVERYEVLKALSEKVLILDPLIIDTFRNPDATVLKLNLHFSNLEAILCNLNENLCSRLGISNSREYHPHITLTYLNHDTPDQVIDEIISNFPKDYLVDPVMKYISCSNGQFSTQIPI